MKKLLEKLKLVQYFNSELTMSKQGFLEMMKEKVDQETPGFLSDSLDAWTKHKNKFKGVFTIDKIVFKRRQTFFNAIISIPKATITFSETDRQSITTKINGLKGPFLAITILVLIGIPVNIFFAFRALDHPELFAPNYFTIILVSSIIMLLFPYFFMRRGMAGLKKRISKELYELES